MATRNPSETPIPLSECTEFQVHVSQRTITLEVIDYSEKKLIKLYEVTYDPVKKLSLSALIDDYRAGHVALAWWKGEPVSIKVTKDR
jgi:hypothetical protein